MAPHDARNLSLSAPFRFIQVNDQLRLNYFLVLIILGLLALGNFLLLDSQLEINRANATVISTSAGQQALTATAGMIARQLVSSHNAQIVDTDRRQLIRIANQLETTHKDILAGKFGEPIQADGHSALSTLFFQPPSMLDRRMNHFISELRLLAAAPPGELNSQNPHYLYIQHLVLSRDLTQALESMVFWFQKQNHNNLQQLRLYNILAFLLTIGTLLWAGFFVFQPTLRQIRQYTQALAAAKTDLEHQLAEKNRLVDTLRQAGERRKLFAAALTHDLKTPIRAEYNILEMLMNEHYGPITSQQHVVIDELLKSNRFTFRMLGNLLTSYRLEDGELQIKTELRNLNKLVQSVVMEDLQLLAQEKQQPIQLIEEHKELLVNIETWEIRRVLYNLVQNAISHSPSNQPIEVTLSKENHYAKVVVKDYGPGINQAELSRLFEPFSGTKKFKHVGTGLGLYVCSEIIKAHGGQLQVASKPGAGCEFYFLLPLASKLPVVELSNVLSG